MKEQTPFDVLRERNLKRVGMLPDPDRFSRPPIQMSLEGFYMTPVEKVRAQRALKRSEIVFEEGSK